MKLQRGSSRRAVAAIAATAMCGAGLAMGAGVAQANPQIGVYGDIPGETAPYTSPVEFFPAVFVLPSGVIRENPVVGTVDHEGWLWTQLSPEQGAWLRDSGVAQAAADAQVPLLKWPASRIAGSNPAFWEEGNCVSFALNPRTAPAAIAGEDVHVHTFWMYGAGNC